MDVADVRADLLAEQQDLDSIVSGLDAAAWSTPTASPRWSVADQIGHLAYFDATAALAITAPLRFKAQVEEMMSAMSSDADAGDDVTLGEFRAMPPEQLLDTWRANRSTLAEAAARLTDDDRIVWYGPSMGAKSFLTARLMEAWAHGQDIVDAVGAEREPTDRLRHIAQLGVITRGWSYVNRGLEPPLAHVLVRLAAPSGATWSFGADDAVQSIDGPALDFCLVVTQRRHVDDTELSIVGDSAREWMELAQAFAGPPTETAARPGGRS
jgi:uncharacterized protein (TIGR03084 family)